MQSCNPFTRAPPHTRTDPIVHLQELAERIASAESREVVRVAEERKKRNYADFWAPIPPTEPFRVVLSHMRDRLYNTRQVRTCTATLPKRAVRQSFG